MSSGGFALPEAGPSKSLPRIGLMATDALRIVGLRAILGDGETCEIVLLAPPMSGVGDGLSLAILDSPSSGEVLELVMAFRRLRPNLAVIVLGAETDPEHIEHVIGAGAKGYLSHSANEAELRMAIDVVRDGSVWAPRKVMARLLEHTMQEVAESHAVPVKFTKRELEVLRLLVLGHPNRQIASVLGVDEGTVKAHMGRVMRKAGVDNRTALTMRAIERRWADV
jgi:DNA-binding NarL/FixJ family response regulator